MMKNGQKQAFDLVVQGDRYRVQYEDWSQDLWWVLAEQTPGEVLLRVKGVEQGQAMEAYRRLHGWYGKQTDMGLAEVHQRALRPTRAKQEEDVERCIEECQ